MSAPEPVVISRSGPLYLVHRGRIGRLVSLTTGRVSAPGLVGSILAHCHAVDPWEDVPAGDPTIPEMVLRAAETLPDSLPDDR